MADELIQEGSRRYPRFRQMYAEVCARVAYRSGDFEEALRRCDTLRRMFPQTAAGFVVAADSLYDLGRKDEAETMLRRGVPEAAEKL